MPHTLKSVLKRTLEAMRHEVLCGHVPNDTSVWDRLLRDLDAVEEANPSASTPFTSDGNRNPVEEAVAEERKRIIRILESLKSPLATIERERNATLDLAIVKINE